MKNVLLCLLFLLIFSCEKASPVFDLQGHRGARGMYPENSIPGFIYAIDQGVNTLELDLCVTKDHQLVVSHEPVISAEICFDTTENAIPDSLQMEYNICQYLQCQKQDKCLVQERTYAMEGTYCSLLDLKKRCFQGECYEGN